MKEELLFFSLVPGRGGTREGRRERGSLGTGTAEKVREEVDGRGIHCSCKQNGFRIASDFGTSMEIRSATPYTFVLELHCAHAATEQISSTSRTRKLRWRGRGDGEE